MKPANKSNTTIKNIPARTRAVGNNQHTIPKNMPKLPALPNGKEKEKIVVTESNRSQKKKKRSKTSQQRGWWDLTGDILYNLGSKALTHGLEMLKGWGDYEVQTNSFLAAATEGKNGGTVPIIYNSKVANILRHREFVGNVLSSTTPFSSTRYPINPGLDKTFPFASPIARCYSNYRMRGCMVEYVSLTSDYSAVGTLGYIALATQYNSIEGPFTDCKALLNSEYSNSCKPSESLAHPIECAPGQLTLSELYIRSGDPPVNTDLRMCDLGVITVAVGSNNNSDAVLGELWITYEMELYFPKLAQDNPSNWLAGTGVGYTDSLPLNGFVKNPVSTMEATILNGNQLMLGDESIGQTYFCCIEYSGPTGATCAPPAISGVNSSLSSFFFAPAQQGSAIITRFTITFWLKLDQGKVGGFAIGNNGNLPFGGYFDMNIIQVHNF